MSISRRKLTFVLATAGISLLAWRSASAQAAYPSKPIRFVVGFPPGGETDLVARLVASKMQEQLGQTVIIDNVPGAGGTIGMARLAKLPADGYVIGVGQSSNLGIGPLLYKDVGYDPVRDFTPVARLAETSFLLVVRADSPYRTLDELLAAARAKPSSINYGSAGIGGTTQLAGELLARQSKVEMTHVPYRGTAPAMVGLLGGEVQFQFASASIAMPHLRAGKLRALATTGAGRSRLFPDVPTIASSIPGYQVVSWFGIVAPPGLPAAIQQRLAAEAQKALASAEIAERFSSLGMDNSFGGPDELASAIAGDLALWRPVIKAAGIRAE